MLSNLSKALQAMANPIGGSAISYGGIRSLISIRLNDGRFITATALSEINQSDLLCFFSTDGRWYAVGSNQATTLYKTNVFSKVVAQTNAITELPFIICIILTYPHMGIEDKNNDKHYFYIQVGTEPEMRKVHEIIEVSYGASGTFFWSDILANYQYGDIDLIISNIQKPFQFELIYGSNLGEFTYIKNGANDLVFTRQIQDINEPYFLGIVASPRMQGANSVSVSELTKTTSYARETIQPLYKGVTSIYNGNIEENFISSTSTDIPFYYWIFIGVSNIPDRFNKISRKYTQINATHALKLLPDLIVNNTVSGSTVLSGEQLSLNWWWESNPHEYQLASVFVKFGSGITIYNNGYFG